MKFKKLKPILSKTDAVTIRLLSSGCDIDRTFINKLMIPDKYDEMDVIGFGQDSNVEINDPHFKDNTFRGIEFILDDTPDDIHKLSEKKEDDDNEDERENPD